MDIKGFCNFDLMKIIAVIGICLALTACSKEQKNNISVKDYLTAGIPSSGYRTYINNSDTLQIKVFLKQSSQIINDTTVAITTYWLNSDSIPMNYAVEKWFTNNKIQLLKQSLFEPVGPGKVVELKGNFDTTKILSFFDGNSNLSVSFKGIADTAYLMLVNATGKAELDSVKDLNGNIVPGLIINNIEHTTLDFIDSRVDTTTSSTLKRYYTLDQGLIYFEAISGSDTLQFSLSEN